MLSRALPKRVFAEALRHWLGAAVPRLIDRVQWLETWRQQPTAPKREKPSSSYPPPKNLVLSGDSTRVILKSQPKSGCPCTARCHGLSCRHCTHVAPVFNERVPVETP